MSSKTFGNGTKNYPTYHWLVDKTKTMCESYLTKTYLRPLPDGGQATWGSRLGLGPRPASHLSQPAGQGTIRPLLPATGNPRGKCQEVEQTSRVLCSRDLGAAASCLRGVEKVAPRSPATEFRGPLPGTPVREPALPRQPAGAKGGPRLAIPGRG